MSKEIEFNSVQIFLYKKRTFGPIVTSIASLIYYFFLSFVLIAALISFRVALKGLNDFRGDLFEL